jgi:large subunit ribosomal protein L7/L12
MSLRKQTEGRESLSLHLGLFESSELPLRINDAYEDFKASGSVVTDEDFKADGSVVADGEFDVILSDAGSNKAQVIKVVHKLTGLGLKEAKAVVVDEAPRLIKEAVTKEEAQRIAAKLAEVGATVTIK